MHILEVPGASWGLLGASWRDFLVCWRRLGASGRGSWGFLGTSWRVLGRGSQKSSKTHCFFEVSGGSQERLGASWGASWRVFWASRRHLGASSQHLEASWGRLSAFCGSEARNHQKPIGFSRFLKAPRSVLGPLGGVLARLLGVLEAPWGVLEGILGLLGASWGRLGASWGSETRNHQTPIGFLKVWGAPRSVLGPLGSVLALLLGVSEALGGVFRDLEASWGRLGASWGSEARNHQNLLVFQGF